MAKSKAERGRFSSRKKMDVALRVLRGHDLDLVSREAGITAVTVSEWRDQFGASGQAGLESRADDGRADELARLKAMVVELTMRLELSREAVQRLRGGAPLATGRSRDEPRHVAFHESPVWCGVSLSGMGRASVVVLSPARPRGSVVRRTSQARPEDGVHRRGAHRAHSAGAGHLAVSRGRAPQSVGAPAGARNSHVQTAGAAARAVG